MWIIKNNHPSNKKLLDIEIINLLFTIIFVNVFYRISGDKIKLLRE